LLRYTRKDGLKACEHVEVVDLLKAEVRFARKDSKKLFLRPAKYEKAWGVVSPAFSLMPFALMSSATLS
jgi:hypothetical protein